MLNRNPKVARKRSSDGVRELARIPCANLMLLQHSPHVNTPGARGSRLFTKVKAAFKRFHKRIFPNAVVKEVCQTLAWNRYPFDARWQGNLPW